MSKWNIKSGNFAINFWKEVDKLNDKSFQTFLKNLNNSSRINSSSRTDEITNEEISVYFPYSENYAFTNDPITSLVTATADADEGGAINPFMMQMAHFNGHRF